jgi:hypothetical protein
MATDERIREAVEGFLARLRHDLDTHGPALTTHLQHLYEERQDRWRAETDHMVAATRSEFERGLQIQLDKTRAEITREFEARLGVEGVETGYSAPVRQNAAPVQESPAREEMISSSASKQNAQSARAEGMDRLRSAMRRIDEATSLSAILEGLTRGVAAGTSRVAILFIDGTMLRRWSDSGFADADRPFDMPLGETGVMAASIALRQTSFVPPVTAGHESMTPAFMRVSPGHTGLVVPLIVGGDVVAVVYADDVGRPEEQEDAPVWTEEVDLLVRHASLRLENVTSIRTVEVLTR